MDERRVTNRVAKRVMLSVRKADEPKPFMALTTNVSPTGMFVSTERLYPRGTRLLISQTGDPARAQIEVEVVRSVRNDPLLGGGQSGMGLRMIPKPAPATVDTARGQVFSLTFRDPADFLEVLRRDLKRGGAFIPSSILPEIHDVVLVAISVPMREMRVIEMAARVVFHQPGIGFAVEFLDKPGLTAALLALGRTS